MISRFRKNLTINTNVLITDRVIMKKIASCHTNTETEKIIWAAEHHHQLNVCSAAGCNHIACEQYVLFHQSKMIVLNELGSDSKSAFSVSQCQSSMGEALTLPESITNSVSLCRTSFCGGGIVQGGRWVRLPMTQAACRLQSSNGSP